MNYILNNTNFFRTAGILSYIIQAICYYNIAEKVKLSDSYLAFIPFFQFILFFHIIDKSAWNMFLLCIPIVNILFLVYWYIEFFSRFNVNMLVALFSILIPFLFVILLIYVAFSSNIQYVGNTRYR